MLSKVYFYFWCFKYMYIVTGTDIFTLFKDLYTCFLSVTITTNTLISILRGLWVVFCFFYYLYFVCVCFVFLLTFTVKHFVTSDL